MSNTENTKYAPALTLVNMLIGLLEDDSFIEKNMDLPDKEYWDAFDLRDRNISNLISHSKMLIAPYVLYALGEAEESLDKDIADLANDHPELRGVWLLTDYRSEKTDYDIEMIVDAPDSEELDELFRELESIMMCSVRFRLLNKDVLYRGVDGRLFLGGIREIFEGRVKTLYLRK